MIPYLRKKKIVEILENEEIFYIDDFLNHIEGISKSTLRRDLKDLEDEDVVVFLKGGAVKLKSQSLELPVSTKLGLQKKEKDIIAKTAHHIFLMEM
jgi:DeoR family fructose operon transcriptional repressor